MQTSFPDSLSKLSSCLRAGKISASEVVAEYLRRSEQKDSKVKAWACLAAEQARDEAAGLSKASTTPASLGPLGGIPFGVKDIYDTAGIPTEWGSPLCRGHIPSADAELVAELRQAGAVMLGKNHTTAFAFFDPGPTRNPYNLAHTPGGSSSGSAAAVAAGMVPFALGSQTMGSVLRPASYCGVTGLKPTFGGLSTKGVLPFAPSLDHCGLFTRTVEDMSFLWSALGNQAGDPSAKTKLALMPWPPRGKLDPEMEQGMRECRRRLVSGGVVVDTIALPESFAALPDATQTVLRFEAAATHAERFRRHGERIGAHLARLVQDGLDTERKDYETALRTIERCRLDFSRLGAGFPVWLTPAALGPAPKGLASTGDPICNAPFTALGVPALALPFGLSKDGLPLGLQLAAPSGREDLLLSAGRVCERILGVLPRPRLGNPAL